MNVVDSSGWLEFFGEGAHGDVYAPVIQDSANLLVPVICIYEVFKRVTQLRDGEEALQTAALMATGEVVEVTLEIALLAADLSIAHKLPMADSLILATTRLYEATLWTQDAHFKGLDGVKFIE